MYIFIAVILALSIWAFYQNYKWEHRPRHEHKFTIPDNYKGVDILRCEHPGCNVVDPVEDPHRDDKWNRLINKHKQNMAEADEFKKMYAQESKLWEEVKKCDREVDEAIHNASLDYFERERLVQDKKAAQDRAYQLWKTHTELWKATM